MLIIIAAALIVVGPAIEIRNGRTPSEERDKSCRAVAKRFCRVVEEFDRGRTSEDKEKCEYDVSEEMNLEKRSTTLYITCCQVSF